MTEHPREFTDTDPRAMAVWMEVLRAKTPGERIAMAFDLSQFAVRVAESGVRARHPLGIGFAVDPRPEKIDCFAGPACAERDQSRD